MKQDIEDALEVPEGVTVTYKDGVLSVQGQAGQVERKLYRPRVSVSVKDGSIVLSAKKGTQREKRHLYTLRAHARNMLKGASEGHTYKLKICSGHFPMRGRSAHPQDQAGSGCQGRRRDHHRHVIG